MPQRMLAAVAGGLSEAGFAAEVLDFGLPEHSGSEAGSGPVGVAVAAAVAHSPQLVVLQVSQRKDVRPARETATRLRALVPSCTILAVGTYIESYGEVLVREEAAFDAAVLLDPEIAVAEAAIQVDSGVALTGTPNMVVEREGAAHRGRRTVARTLDELPLPDYSPSVYPSLYQSKKLHIFEIEHCRGGASPQMGPTAPWSVTPMRLKSPSVCVREIDHVRHYAPAAGAFHVSGAAPAAAVEHLCYELRGLDRPIRYSRETQVPGFDTLSPPSLYVSGCRVVRFPLHSGSQRLLEDFYGQGFTVSQAERALQRAQRARLTRLADFTFPVPHDDRHTRAETVRLLSRTMPDAVTVSAPELRPESTWRDWQAAYGFNVEDAAYRDWAACAPGAAQPYSMQGWEPGAVQRECDCLLREVADLGIHAGLTAREGLMARVLDLDERLDQFRLLQQEAVLREDTLLNLIRIFNERASLPTQAAMWFPFQPQLLAVNN